MGTDMPCAVSFSISRSLAMICSTLCFFTGTKGLLRSYQICSQPQTKWTDLGGPHSPFCVRPAAQERSMAAVDPPDCYVNSGVPYQEMPPYTAEREGG